MTAISSTSQFQALFVEARRALVNYQEQPESQENWQELLKVRRSLAELVASLPVGQRSGPMVEVAGTVLRAFEESGAADQVAAPEDLALAEQYRKKNWPGLLAAMLLVPAWQFPSAPRLDDLQPWLWAEYTRWLFYTPKGFTAVGQVESYSKHYLKRLEELAQWGARNRGSAAVRGALQVYMRIGNCIPLYFDSGNVRQHFAYRGKILAAAAGVETQPDLQPIPREGRRVRFGVINRHFGEQTETYGTLPTFEHLDPDRFEVVLFAHYPMNCQVEEYCRSRAVEFHLLPKAVADQVAAVRAANLDIVSFGTNVTAVFHDVANLALYRLAPLQVINMSSCTTSGFEESDLYVSGKLTEVADAAEHFTERLGLISAPAHAFQYEVDRKEAVVSFTRQSLGIPEDAVVFVSASNYFKVIPEMQHSWARLLAAVPNSRLLLHPFNPNWSSAYPIKRFCAEFDKVLAQHGVSHDRLIVSSNKFPSRTDVKELLRVGDVYLDTFPFAGVNSLVDPLELGVTPVAWEGNTFRSRMGSGLLRSMGLEELVVTNEEDYLKLAQSLAADPLRRKQLGEKIRGQMERSPIFLDTLAHSDAFGDVVLAAYDELVEVGRKEFRRRRTPITCATEDNPAAVLAEGVQLLEAGDCEGARNCARKVLDQSPASPEARFLMGRVFQQEAKFERAVTYLLAAVQHAEGNASLWYHLAQALRFSGRREDAIEALETSLRVDSQNLDSWFLFLELAEQGGQADMVKEILQAMKQIAPDDPRVVAKAALAGVF